MAKTPTLPVTPTTTLAEIAALAGAALEQTTEIVLTPFTVDVSKCVKEPGKKPRLVTTQVEIRWAEL